MQQVVATPAEDVKVTNDEANRIIELGELKAHQTTENLWFVVSGEVYDGTTYLKDNLHPGGEQSIVLSAGLDVTEGFLGVCTQFLLRPLLFSKADHDPQTPNPKKPLCHLIIWAHFPETPSLRYPSLLNHHLEALVYQTLVISIGCLLRSHPLLQEVSL